MSKLEPIRIYNRYTKAEEVESVFGEKWLRWAYENPLGLLTTRMLVARKFVSRWYGRKMSSSKSAAKIRPFIEEFGLDPEEFADPVDSFGSFNEFFTRRLKPEARPIDDAENHVIFPADGRHLVVPVLGEEQQLFVKGQKWSLKQLLRDPVWEEKFKGGSLVLSRLCPVDYHHFHFPIAGIPEKAISLKGPLFSVNPIALRKDLGFLAGNYRQLTPIKQSLAGTVLFMEIGATMVGSIVQDFEPNRPMVKGSNKGYFEFGGSSVITLFPPNTIRFAEDLLDSSQRGIELYAKMGDFMGEITSPRQN